MSRKKIKIRKYRVMDIGNGFGDEGRQDRRLGIFSPNGKMIVLMHMDDGPDLQKIVNFLNRKLRSK